MIKLHKIKRFWKKAFTPITIMLIPHSNIKTLKLKIPSIGIIIAIILWICGTIYIFSTAVETIEYRSMRRQYRYYSQQFKELNSAISVIKKAETEFKKLFRFGLKEQILEHMDTSTGPDQGSIDMESLRKEIANAVETVTEVKDFLHQQRSIYVATPKLLPVEGRITSYFGMREHPLSGEDEFHRGVDISVPRGTPIRATASGIVSYSGGSGIKGNVVAIEHGAGFTTIYAHNSVNIVKVGQEVRKGDIIAYVGTTGNATGPHVHFEVWKDGKPVNPLKYVGRRR